MLLPFTEEQEALRAMIRDFARHEVASFVPSMEERNEFPAALIKKLGELACDGSSWGCTRCS